MANKTYRDMAVAMDDATGILRAITSHVNQASMAGVQSLLEDSILSSDERSYLPGIAGATVSLNGFINTTTNAIFGPLVGNRTSISKTIQFYNGVSYYRGEAYPTNIQMSGSMESLMTWSGEFTFDDAITKTSVSTAV